MLKRVFKMLAVLCTNIGLNLILQLLLPPSFLHFYGITRYGEWLVLSATVAYLTTLNFGISNYAGNELTMLRKRGQLTEYRELQASTLAMLLGIVATGILISSSAFFLPLKWLLHITTMGRLDIALTVFFLGLLITTYIFGGYFNNLFMVIQETHRGQVWFSLRWFGASIAPVPLAFFRAPFYVLALGQFSVALAVSILTLVDLKSRMRGLPLGLRGATWKTVKASIGPSGMFGMIFSQQFLLFQAPVILLNWLLGPEVVVLFTIGRTIFSTARQSIQIFTTAIAPEITFSFADQDTKRLLNIFHYSEKVVFSLIPVANVGAFLLSPILLNIWLHRPSLFDPFIYALLALISGAISMRDHKQFFQFSTNTHKRLAVIVFFGNVLMIAASIPVTIRFGVYGFLFVWLISELLQMSLIYHENKKLFSYNPAITFVPVLTLESIMLISVPVSVKMVELAMRRSLFAVGGTAACGIVTLIAVSYFVFGLKDVKDVFRMRFAGGLANRTRETSIERSQQMCAPDEK